MGVYFVACAIQANCVHSPVIYNEGRKRIQEPGIYFLQFGLIARLQATRSKLDQTVPVTRSADGYFSKCVFVPVYPCRFTNELYVFSFFEC